MKAFVFAAAAALIATPAHAGLVMKWDRTTANQPAEEMTLQCEGNRARFEGKNGDGMIWDASTGQMPTLRAADKTWRRIDVKAMKAQMESARAAMAGKLAALPPEKRAQMEKMMGAAAAPGERKPVKFTATGKKDKVSAWDCEWYDVASELVAYKACVVPWDKVKLKKEDFGCLESLSESGTGGAEADWKTWPGAVVSTVKYDEKGAVTTTLKSVAKTSVPDSAFAPPAGYKEAAGGKER